MTGYVFAWDLSMPEGGGLKASRARDLPAAARFGVKGGSDGLPDLGMLKRRERRAPKAARRQGRKLRFI